MKLLEEVGLEKRKSTSVVPLGIAAGLPLLAGGAYLVYRKLRQEVPPAPAWDAELQPPPQARAPRLDQHDGDSWDEVRREVPAAMSNVRPYEEGASAPDGGDRRDEPRSDTAWDGPRRETPEERVEYTNEFGEKAVGIPGGGLDALPLTPIDETELALRFGRLIGKGMIDLMESSAGSVEAVYYRRLRGEPEWVAATIGLVDKRRVLIPLDGATIGEGDIRLSVPNSMIEAAPTVTETELSGELEKGLYAHYMVRRMLPGLEGERDEDGLLLRMWAPVATEMGESVEDRPEGGIS